MVFGMISAAGPGAFVRLHGQINASVYKELLKQHVLPKDCCQPTSCIYARQCPVPQSKIYQYLFSEKNETNGLACTEP